MNDRRDFLKKAAIISGAAGMVNRLPAAVQRALAIDPEPGSTWTDAEHIVLLMQENRSFDHCFGCLQGVRGFNDPRTITLPNSNKVWLQTNDNGDTYAPFRLDIKDTKATWMSSLPHSWDNQLAARNNGMYDKWLDSKKGSYPHIPMTLGYYTREDIPFYYGLADAFTVCDQHFCSSLTGTTPNRLFFWTGNLREDAHAKARVYNSDTYFDAEASWKTFPEHLQENNISWKIYQNELSTVSNLTDKQDVWLGNFEDNPIIWFTQYKVKLSAAYLAYMQEAPAILNTRKQELQNKLPNLQGKEKEDAANELKGIDKSLAQIEADKPVYTKQAYNKLSTFEKEIHNRAFVTNSIDPDYHSLTELTYDYHHDAKKMLVPKGDILKQLRLDVENGELPAVSWIVAPENYCDHPSAPWYGAWYISEVLDILTKNPDVWKKTIFMLTYDENDGAFDHVPPFVPPHPFKKETGIVTDGIDTTIDHADNKLGKSTSETKEYDAEGPIGLGYRVPLVIASPWSRGGFVCSQVFDHTSSLMFLEKFVNKKYQKKIKQENISTWRRAVCGDLTAVFRPFNGEDISVPVIEDQNAFLETVNKAQFKDVPNNYKKLTKHEIEQINNDSSLSPYFPLQEKGTRGACAIPYELYADGKLSDDASDFEITLKCGNTIFNERSAGAPFHIYTPTSFDGQNAASKNYAVEAGKALSDAWPLRKFANNAYHICVYGPNGFYRKFTGNAKDPKLDVLCTYQFTKSENKLTGNVLLHVKNNSTQAMSIHISDNAYQASAIVQQLLAAEEKTIVIDTTESYAWYDVSVKVQGYKLFEKQFAGHVETGNISNTDPLMGRSINMKNKAMVML